MTESYDPFNHTLFLACDRTLRKEHHDTLLLPWMTLDMLKGEAKVLQLLHHRISNAPEEWVTFDNYQILRGWQVGNFEASIAMLGVCSSIRSRPHGWMYVGYLPHTSLNVNPCGR